MRWLSAMITNEVTMWRRLVRDTAPHIRLLGVEPDRSRPPFLLSLIMQHATNVRRLADRFGICERTGTLAFAGTSDHTRLLSSPAMT